MNESFQAEHEERLRRGKMPLDKKELPERHMEKGEIPTYQGMQADVYRQKLEAIHGPELANAFETVMNVCEQIQAAGGKALLVGGAVRDEILGEASKDLDLEVYGLEPSVVEQILTPLGKISSVGKAFGIFILSNEDSAKIDISFPRTDSIPSEDGDGFAKADPTMSVTEAAKRRDFTFNALAKDPLTGEIFDPFNGIDDLRNRRLHVTDAERFTDDPVRILRGAQFMGRFGLSLESSSRELMESLVPTLIEKPKERIFKEVDKLLTQSIKPSIGLMMYHDLGILDVLFPELADLRETKQEFEWHPEGDVWVHTLMVVDVAAQVCRFHRLSKETTQTIMWAALCHDFGKPSTTKFEDDRIRSIGHEPAGEAPTRTFLQRLGVSELLENKVVQIVKEHLWPGTTHRQQIQFEHVSKLFGPITPKQRTLEPVSDGAFRRLAKRLHPATIEELTFAAEADSLGRGPFVDADNVEQFLLPNPYVAGAWVRQRAEELGVYQEEPVPTVTGKDLLGLGFSTKRGGDIRIGTVMYFADLLRDDREYTREDVLVLIIESITSNNKKPDLDKTLERLREEVGEEEWKKWETEQEQIAQERLQRKAEKLKEQQLQREAKKQG